MSGECLNIFIRTVCAVTAFFLFLRNNEYRKHTEAHKFLQGFILCIGFWNLAYIGYLSYDDTARVILMNSLIFGFNAFTAAFYFLFTFSFAFPATKIRHMSTLIFVVPALTAFFSVSDLLPGFMFAYGDKIIDSVNRVQEFPGPWYYIHTAYSYALVAAGIFFLFLKLRKKSTHNRLTILLVIFGSAFFIAWIFLLAFILWATNKSIAVSGLAHFFCIILFYAAIRSDKVERMILQMEQNIEDTLPVPVFIVDPSGLVVFFNNSAKKLLKAQSMSTSDEFPFEDVLSKYTKQEQLGNLPEFDNETCFILEEPRTNSFWYVHEHPLEEKRKPIGFFYSFLSIDNISKMMNLLEKYAFRDILTGAYNRHFFEMTKESICDSPAQRMTLIMCDIDNLKQVNDTYGHIEGDKYIQECTQCLFASVRKKDFIFRIGGDEFLLLLPESDEKAAKIIVRRINENQNFSLKDRSISPGISVGYATGEICGSRDFLALIDEADKSMYRNKQRKKRKLFG